VATKAKPAFNSSSSVPSLSKRAACETSSFTGFKIKVVICWRYFLIITAVESQPSDIDVNRFNDLNKQPKRYALTHHISAWFMHKVTIKALSSNTL
jgi:hypothetical protein